MASGVLSCPTCILAPDPDVVEHAAASSWQAVQEAALASGRCPACPVELLTPESRTLYGTDQLAQRCGCCGALWLIDDREYSVLDQGLLSVAHGEWWSAAQCAAHAGIAGSTWRDYVADLPNTPKPGPGRDPHTGHLRWWADTVRAWAVNRSGQGKRTDLDPHAVGGVHISANTVAAAGMIAELASGGTVSRAVLRDRWLEEFPEDGHTAPPARNLVAAHRSVSVVLGDRRRPRPPSSGTLVRKRLGNALAALEKVGAIRRGTVVLQVLDRELLERIAAL